jgi:predicted RNA methylase
MSANFNCSMSSSIKVVLMPSVPTASSPAMARTLAKYILEAGYTEDRLKALGLTKTPWKDSTATRLLSRRLDEASALYVLVRLFCFGEEIPCRTVEAILPENILTGLQQTNMITCEGDNFVPACMLVHFNEFLIACDSVRRARSGQLDDLVLGVNKPTQILGNCMIHLTKPGSVLDLGTGCGTLAFLAAPDATEVIGTDINGRALEFARFNAALNGVEHFDVASGDRFEPVRGQKFDLIVSNPPFFLTPSSKLLFTDNPFALDSFVQSLAEQAPAFLNEGGYFQMLCEWVQFGSEPWRERVERWFHNAGCDVLILTDYEISPAEYTLQRATESVALHGEMSLSDLNDHLKYFRDRGVEKILGGLLTVRRSSTWPDGRPRSQNWFLVDETGGRPTSPIGDQILDRFKSEDIISTRNEARLLAAKPRIAKDVALIQEATHKGKAWETSRIYMERRSGLIRRLAFNSEIAELVASWDGSQDLDYHVTAFARNKGLSKKQVTSDILGLVRRLSSLNLISLS